MNVQAYNSFMIEFFVIPQKWNSKIELTETEFEIDNAFDDTQGKKFQTYEDIIWKKIKLSFLVDLIFNWSRASIKYVLF